jgi:hypothetical protein
LGIVSTTPHAGQLNPKGRARGASTTGLAIAARSEDGETGAATMVKPINHKQILAINYYLALGS